MKARRVFTSLLNILICALIFLNGCSSSDPIPRPKSSEKSITSYSLNGVAGIINETEKTVTVAMPFGADVTDMVAAFTTTGASVKVGSTDQVSGITANDFTNQVTYTVTAADSSTQDYTVVVTVAAESAKAITLYSLNGFAGTINETNKTIAVTLPFGSLVTNKVATFTTTGASVKVGSTVQISGSTANNFTSPVVYIVTAADSSTQDYTVTVNVAQSSAKAITAFSLNGSIGTIDEANKTIAVTMPYGTYVMNLVATFTTTGSIVEVSSADQISGKTAHNFTDPVTYTVVAADSSTQDYIVTVTVASSPAKAITAYSLNGVAGTIDETNETIAVTMLSLTNVTSLVATFATTGASVKVGSTAQVSGATANNFTSPVTYTVTAADGTTAKYTVTVIYIDAQPGSIARMAVSGTSVYVHVLIKPNNFTFTGSLNVTASDTAGIFLSSVLATANDDGTYTLTLTTSNSTASGSYTGSVTLNLYSDASCTTPQRIPSIALPFNINLLSPSSAWSGNNLTTLSAWPGAPDWSMFQGNAAHTGFVPVTVDPNQFSTRWNMPEVKPSGFSGSSKYGMRVTLAVENGLFYNAGSNKLYARNESDSNLVWQYDFSGLTFPSVNPPAVKDGVLYIAAGQLESLYFFTFNASNGALIFQKAMTSQWDNYLAPTIGANGVYTNAGTYGGLYGFDLSGRQMFFAGMAQTSMWTPAVDAIGVYTYTGVSTTAGALLKVINPTTGAVLHSITDTTFALYGYEIGGSPVLGSAGSVFVANYDNAPLNGGAIGNTLLNFNIVDNSIAWSVTGCYPTTPAYANGVLYVANDKAPLRLEVRAESDGALLWSWAPPQAGDTNFKSEVLLTNNLVFVSTNLATYAIDINTHKVVWSYPLTGRLALSKNGILYIQGIDLLVAINLK